LNRQSRHPGSNDRFQRANFFVHFYQFLFHLLQTIGAQRRFSHRDHEFSFSDVEIDQPIKFRRAADGGRNRCL
jgi:hypothetical protein